MTVPFTQIGASRRIPLFIAEIGRGQGAPGSFVNPSIMLGQKNTSGGTASAGARYRITSSGQAATLFGRGSPAALMCAAFLRRNPTGELYAAALGDASGSPTAAARAITFAGTATEAGTLMFRIGGQLVEVGVAVGNDKTAVAAAFHAAVNAALDLSVASALSGDDNEISTVTAKFKGTVGNQVNVSLNALGQSGGEATPAGITVTIAGSSTLPSGGVTSQLTGGATDPTAASWVTALADDPYDVIAYQDTVSGVLDVLKTEMIRRWDANTPLRGHVITAHADSLADHETANALRNDAHLSIAEFKETVGWLSPAFEVAGSVAGIVSSMLAVDPAANLQLQPLTGIWGNGANFTDAERDDLAGKGGMTLVARNGVAYLEYEATTRFKNEFGDLDSTWEEVQTPFTLMRLERRLKNRIETRYGSHKLADDGQPIKSGQKIVTPQILKGEVLRELEACGNDGLIESSPEALAALKADLIVERSETNPSRVESSVSPDLINRFRVFAVLLNFKT